MHFARFCLWCPMSTLNLRPSRSASPPNSHYVAIIPALNEAACIGRVVSQLVALRRPDGSPTFVAVAVGDNGSTDRTCEVAASAGALVGRATKRGYGHGCIAAIEAAPSADVFVFVDGDDTTDYTQIESLLVALEAGTELVIGRRVRRAPGSMSLAQMFGNALCCWLIRVLWGANVHDLGPLRAMCAPAFRQLNMQALTYGWTLEMQIKAFEQNRYVVEVPVSTAARPDGVSKVSPNWRSALRCGRVMLATIATLWLTRSRRNSDRTMDHSFNVTRRQPTQFSTPVNKEI